MVEAKSSQVPRGIPYIVGNEAAERFSYYGMRSILVVFMTKYLLDRSGNRDLMSPEEAKAAYHTFTSAVYFLPFFGAILADAFLGKYRTIMLLSLVYCLGHFTLALDSTRLGLAIGLGLIAMGAGGIKPCVSATVGDQFTTSNQHLISRVYGWFYFSINFGSAFATMWIPYLLDKQGPHVAFAVPGIFMLIATIIFWLGRRKFIHVPPTGMAFIRDVLGPLGRQTMLKLASIYIFIAVFWSLWDQTASAWVLQAEKMDLRFLGRDWLVSQIQTANPVFTLTFIPLFSYLIYPAIDKVFPLTPLRKIGLGLFLTVPAFLIPTWVEHQIGQGLRPNIGWHFLAYALITAAEVMISITSLEFAYTQAPNRMKSFIMSFYLGAIALGNGFTAIVNKLIQNPDKTSKLPGVQYYIFFDVVMLLTAITFIFVALRYKEQTYIQDESHVQQ
ncbi:MAG TPA: POT family MFS transporter [Verrucomicrobiae bacterium]|nr:POT family MFS transporter [Verrucomicrobiae bacterium]